MRRRCRFVDPQKDQGSLSHLRLTHHATAKKNSGLAKSLGVFLYREHKMQAAKADRKRQDKQQPVAYVCHFSCAKNLLQSQATYLASNSWPVLGQRSNPKR